MIEYGWWCYYDKQVSFSPKSFVEAQAYRVWNLHFPLSIPSMVSDKLKYGFHKFIALLRGKEFSGIIDGCEGDIDYVYGKFLQFVLWNHKFW